MTPLEGNDNLESIFSTPCASPWPVGNNNTDSDEMPAPNATASEKVVPYVSTTYDCMHPMDLPLEVQRPHNMEVCRAAWFLQNQQIINAVIDDAVRR